MKDHKLFTIFPYKDHLIELENPIRAVAYYKNFSVNLLTGERHDQQIKDFLNECAGISLNEEISHPRVVHLFYELSFLLLGDEKKISDNTLLGIDLEFASFHEVHPTNHPRIELKLESWPDQKNYQAAFHDGYEELLKGNCYQFNLTYPFVYSFTKKYSPKDFIFSMWKDQSKRGAFGSATFIPSLKTLFFSNSPECLFQIKDQVLSSMPIKGTLKRVESDDWKVLWKKLTKDQKNQAELFMITDLLRNDLSRIEKPCAQITKKKFPKLVPGLIHQCSKIDVPLSADVSLLRIIQSLFPGGSITGAPKVRAIQLIHKLEQRERNFYCGSTILLYKNMKSASINIRSAEICFDDHHSTLRYQAGGGVTLLSRADEEFQEMAYKHNSFIDVLTH